MGGQAIQFTKEALYLVLMLSAPPIIAASVVGLVVAVLQAVTQVQEQATQYLCKFVAVILTLFLTASFLGGTLYNFTDRLFLHLPTSFP